MLAKSLILTLFLLVSSVIGGKSCRQCTGYRGIIFRYHTSEQEAVAFFLRTINEKSCFTGGDYEILNKTKDDCVDGKDGSPRCRSWAFTLNAWRYCGNGDVVRVKRDDRCLGNNCAVYDLLSMHCSMSVFCRGDCDIKQC